MSNLQIDLLSWHDARRLSKVPKHFILSHIPSNHEQIIWIDKNLSGRYALLFDKLTFKYFPAFELEKDAVWYNLSWS